MLNIKKLYFLGAGSTSMLGMPTTEKQENLFKAYQVDKKDDILSKFLNDFYSDRKLTLNSLYNLLDQSIISKMTLDSPNENGNSYTTELLRVIRRKCNGVILEKFEKIIKAHNKRKDFGKWIDFYKRLALKGLSKKKNDIIDDVLKKPEFIHHDYAIVNLNWDLFSNIPMMIAHDEVNHSGNNYVALSSGNKRVSIYSDFSFSAPFVNGKKDENGNVKTTWYSYNDSACYRLNDPKNKSNKIATIVKTYLLHGNMNLFRCSHCGNHVFLLDKIDMQNDALYIDARFRDEKIAICPYCNKEIHSLDNEMLMQSNFKIKSPYIEKMQEEFKAVVRGAEEIIFLGYSLPIDDIDYRTIFTALVNNKAKIKVVLFNEKYVNYNKFERLDFYNLSDREKSDAKHFTEVFGENNVLFNFCGVPNVFDNDDIY